MAFWVRLWAQRIALVGGCLSLIAGVLLGNRVPTVCLRSVVVAVALYLTVRIFGRVIGATILRAAISEQLRQEEPESGPRSAKEKNNVNAPAA